MKTSASHRIGASMVSVVAVALLLASTLTGCDKLPTAGELQDQISGAVSGEDESTASTDASTDGATSQPNTPAPNEPEPEPAPEKPSRTPQEVIADINARESYQFNDGLLAEAGALESGLEELTKLDIRNSPITAAGIQSIGKLTHLVELYVGGNSITDPEYTTAFSMLPALKNLEIFDATKTHFNDSCAQYLAQLPAIRELNLGYTLISDDAFQHFASLKTLEVVRVNNDNILGHGFEVFNKNDIQLKTFDASFTQFGTGGMGHLSDRNSLEVLLLVQAEINDQNIAAIKPLKELRELYLDRNQITDNSLKVVRTLKNLEILSLMSCGNISNNGMRLLTGSRHLVELKLAKSGVTEQVAAELKEKFLKNTAVYTDTSKF